MTLKIKKFSSMSFLFLKMASIKQTSFPFLPLFLTMNICHTPLLGNFYIFVDNIASK